MTMPMLIAIAFLAALAPLAKADPSKPTRVIEISKENAARSAAIIAAAKSPLIGMPPLGKAILSASSPSNSYASLAAKTPEVIPGKVASRDDFVGPHSDPSDSVQVQIVRNGDAGTVVQTVVVPRQR